MNFRYAVFDFDGTLFDSMFIWDTVGELYLKSIGKEPEPFLRDKIRTFSLKQSAQYFQQKYHIALSEKEIADGINKIIEDFYFDEVQPKSNVINFLHILKQAGFRMCIATATDRYLIEKALERCSMENFFEKIFTCGEVGYGKDTPMIFRKAIEYFPSTRENTLIFEDAFHALQSAKQDNFITVGVYDESEPNQIGVRKMSDYFLTSFDINEVKGFALDNPTRGIAP